MLQCGYTGSVLLRRIRQAQGHILSDPIYVILRNTTYGNVAAKPAVSAPRTRRKEGREFKVNPRYINKL